MDDILDKIIQHKKIEIKESRYTGLTLDARVELHPRRSMKESLIRSSSGIISEFKRRSPSKGWIKQDGDVSVIPASYQNSGASAISILTDRQFFGGDISDLIAARKLVDIPILRKDFIIDTCQIVEAKNAGADAILLIAAALSTDQCAELAAAAKELGLEILLEIHAPDELRYVSDAIDMVGVNNRHLGTFVTDVKVSYDIAGLLPKDHILVSESGISKPETVAQLRQAGYRGFLIGENFMKTPDPGSALADFINELERC